MVKLVAKSHIFMPDLRTITVGFIIEVHIHMPHVECDNLYLGDILGVKSDQVKGKPP